MCVQKRNGTALPLVGSWLDDHMVMAAAGRIFQCSQHDRSCSLELHGQKRRGLTPPHSRQLHTHAHVCRNGMAFDSGIMVLVLSDAGGS